MRIAQFSVQSYHNILATEWERRQFCGRAAGRLSLLNLVQTLLIKIEALPPAIVKWDGTLLNTQLEI